MKKLNKQSIFIIFIIFIVLILTNNNEVYARVPSDQPNSGMTINDLNPNKTDDNSKTKEQEEIIQGVGERILGIMNVVGVVLSVVMLGVLGIKYMTGSIEQKADYKKALVPYLIGAILLFAAPTIANMVYSALKQ